MGRCVRQPGQRDALAGLAYRGERLACALRAFRKPGHEGPGLPLTDLPPQAGNPCWYAWRAWSEPGFQGAKSGGVNWRDPRVAQTHRAGRPFWAVAVTTVGLVAAGAEGERRASIEAIARLAEGQAERGRGRRVRLVAPGLAAVRAALIDQESLPQGNWFQECWPEAMQVPALSEQEFPAPS